MAQQLNEKIGEEERDSLVLWKSPVRTLYFAQREILLQLKLNLVNVLKQKAFISLILMVAFFWFLVEWSEGPSKTYTSLIKKKCLWAAYWVGLGILSSIGLGSGLHTFILYLGPHIAKVTLAAYSCGTVDFPEPPYPERTVCPSQMVQDKRITLWIILGKVYLEAMLWGVGTAIGELPPYFMARASRLAGYDPENENEELRELQELQAKMKDSPEALSWLDKAKILIENLVKKVGFFGILLCSSFPNPLFDLCGITCGHFLVPIKTFFGAVVLGKSCIKVITQAILVIIAFSDSLLESIMGFVQSIPSYGPSFRHFLEKTLHAQKEKLYHKAHEGEEESSSVIGFFFESFVFLMVAYFIISILNSFAQTNHKRMQKKKEN